MRVLVSNFWVPCSTMYSWRTMIRLIKFRLFIWIYMCTKKLHSIYSNRIQHSGIFLVYNYSYWQFCSRQRIIIDTILQYIECTVNSVILPFLMWQYLAMYRILEFIWTKNIKYSLHLNPITYVHAFQVSSQLWKGLHYGFPQQWTRYVQEWL